jgi:transposase-like protein
MRYSPERKEAILKKMMPPNNLSISRLAEQEGISEVTLYKWRKQARQKGILMPDADTASPNWTSRDKFAAVVETAPLNENDRAQYCRQKAIFPEQLHQWRQACENANDWDHQVNRQLKAQQKADHKRIKALEKELLRKEKALAETAALLVLKKNFTKSINR